MMRAIKAPNLLRDKVVCLLAHLRRLLQSDCRVMH